MKFIWLPDEYEVWRPPDNSLTPTGSGSLNPTAGGSLDPLEGYTAPDPGLALLAQQVFGDLVALAGLGAAPDPLQPTGMGGPLVKGGVPPAPPGLLRQWGLPVTRPGSTISGHEHSQGIPGRYVFAPATDDLLRDPAEQLASAGPAAGGGLGKPPHAGGKDKPAKRSRPAAGKTGHPRRPAASRAARSVRNSKRGR